MWNGLASHLHVTVETGRDNSAIKDPPEEWGDPASCQTPQPRALALGRGAPTTTDCEYQ